MFHNWLVFSLWQEKYHEVFYFEAFIVLILGENVQIALRLMVIQMY